MPPSGGRPKRNNDCCFNLLCNKLSPNFSYKSERSIDPTIVLPPIITKGVDSGSHSTLMYRKKNFTKVVCIWRIEVNGMRTPSDVQQIKIWTTKDQSSGINILEISSAKALDSRWTHSTEIVILCKRQNQKSSRANTLRGSFGLPLLTMPRKCSASTCKTTTNFPLHLSRSACKHQLSLNNSRYVEDWIASHAEKYLNAT